jgi:hypothetical protein
VRPPLRPVWCSVYASGVSFGSSSSHGSSMANLAALRFFRLATQCPLSIRVRRPHRFRCYLLHTRNTRYGWLVRPYPAGTCTLQESVKLRLTHQRRGSAAERTGGPLDRFVGRVPLSYSKPCTGSCQRQASTPQLTDLFQPERNCSRTHINLHLLWS